MKKPLIELLIVALMAVPIGAHGVSALLSHRMWVSPKHSKPYEMVGSGADLMGLAWLALAAGLFAVWFAIRTPWRKLGIGLIGLCALVSGGSFAVALGAQ